MCHIILSNVFWFEARANFYLYWLTLFIPICFVETNTIVTEQLTIKILQLLFKYLEYISKFFFFKSV